MRVETIDGKDLVIFGEPEEGALQQAKNCLKDAEAVLLMGDAHKGYGMPVGGVAVYNGKVSPAGVGFDIACFVGTQQVALADGRSVSFLEMIEEANAGIAHFGFSLSSSGDVVVERLEAPRQTGVASELVALTLDNGQNIECTLDHVFIMRDGQEIKARDIQEGVSLMPLYLEPFRNIPKEQRQFKDKHVKLGDYTAVFNPGDSCWALVHHLADDFNLRNGLDNTSDGPIRHHKDFNKLNNNPTNVKRMESWPHFALHSRMARQLASEGKIGFKRLHEINPGHWSGLGTSNMNALHQDPAFCERRDARARIQMQKLLKSDSCRKNWDAAGQRGRATLVEFNRSEKGRAQASQNTLRPRKCKACGGSFENQSAFLAHYHAAHAGARLNHCVASVRRVILDEPVPVYCLTAPATANFALACGVFVHNCGNKAILTDAENVDLPRVATEISKKLSFGVGRVNAEEVDHDLFSDPTWDDLDIYKDGTLKDLARRQLGTIGSGNHYVDVFADELGRYWVGVHFGSRGLGHKTASHFMKLAGDNPNIMDETPHVLDVNSDLGEQYLKAMELCGRYAYAGRDWVCDKVAEIMGAHTWESVHNHHNFAWEENGSWIVRKGATPARPGQMGFVGASMGGDSVILQGTDSPNAWAAYNSTVHGAGRVMSRTAAAGKSKWIHGKKTNIGGGKVDWAAVKAKIAENGTILVGAGADEAPECYKSLPEVLKSQGDTIRVIHTLKPLIVAMAGLDEFDPYKD